MVQEPRPSYLGGTRHRKTWSISVVDIRPSCQEVVILTARVNRNKAKRPGPSKDQIQVGEQLS